MDYFLTSVYWPGKGLKKQRTAKLRGSLTNSSNASTASSIQQQTLSSSKLSPRPIHVDRGPLGESTPNAAQDIENSLFGFDWSTPPIVSPVTVSPIVSSCTKALPRKRHRPSPDTLQDTPVSSRVQQQAEVERRLKAVTPKRRYAVYDTPVQPFKFDRNNKPKPRRKACQVYYLFWEAPFWCEARYGVYIGM